LIGVELSGYFGDAEEMEVKDETGVEGDVGMKSIVIGQD
jgi:hypothetical protein